jgi:hypothetical protein
VFVDIAGLASCLRARAATKIDPPGALRVD